MAAALAVVAVQWLRFSRAMGAFRCWVRIPGAAGRFGRWRRGVARFDPIDLRWFPGFLLLASRSLVLERRALELTDRWSAGENDSVPPGLSVVHGTAGGVTVEIALSPASAAAFVLWVESGPPGRGVDVA